mmetsp:Transcript_94576/g.276396  ORF Transcript_94576/g.276396 Transcript_94576/m.276396 type:complete len:126 (-) Transcript_94576:178-555(-)
MAMKLALLAAFCTSHLSVASSAVVEAVNSHAGVSMLQIISLGSKRAVPETHLDPYNVSNSTLDKPRYAVDWNTEWKPDPNPPNRTPTTTEEMLPYAARSGAPCACGAGIMAATTLGLVAALHVVA